jgi:hypothetical protein
LAFLPVGAADAYYIPTEVTTKGLGKANVQAIESEFSAMQQAATLFRAEDPLAADLQEGVNHVANLSRSTDAPTRYSDTQRYGLLTDSRGWWLGVAVPTAESMRDYVAQLAASKGWTGSPSTSTPPGSAVYQASDEIVWMLFR